MKSPFQDASIAEKIVYKIDMDPFNGSDKSLYVFGIDGYYDSVSIADNVAYGNYNRYPDA